MPAKRRPEELLPSARLRLDRGRTGNEWTLIEKAARVEQLLSQANSVPESVCDAAAPDRALSPSRSTGGVLMRSPLCLLPLAFLAFPAASQEQVPQIVQQTGASATVRVGFGSDGKWLATVDRQGQARIYDLNGGRLSRVMDFDAVGPAAAAIHPSKPAIAALTRDGRTILSDVVTGRTIWTTDSGSCQVLQAMFGSILQFSADGRKLYGGCTDFAAGVSLPKALVKVWDSETGRELSAIPAPEVKAVEMFSTDGQWFAGPAVASKSRRIFRARTTMQNTVIATESGKRIADFPGEYVFGLSARAHLAIVVTEQGIVPWDLSSGKQSPLASFAAANSETVSPFISPDGSKVILAGRSLKIVDLLTGESRVVATDHLPVAFGAALSPDGDHIAVAQGDSALLLSISNPADRRMIGNPTAEMFTANSLPTVASVWGPSEKEQKNIQKKMTDEIKRKVSTATAENWQQIVAEIGRSDNGGRGAAKTAEEQLEDKYRAANTKFGGTVDSFPAATLLQSGRMLAVRAADRAWDIWDVTTGNRLPFRKAPGDPARYQKPEDLLDPGELRELEASLTGTPAAMTADGKPAERFESTHQDVLKTTTGALALYDTKTGRRLCDLENGPAIRSFDLLAGELQFSPDGKLIVGGGNTTGFPALGTLHRRLRIWNASTCQQLPVADTDSAELLGFSPDGSQFFTAIATPTLMTESYGIRVWDAKSPLQSPAVPATPLFDMPDAFPSIKLLLFPPAGNLLMGPDRDHGLGIWDRRTGEKLASLHPLQEGEWVVTTPGGLFDGSPRGWNTIAWRESPTDTSTQPGEIFFNEFYRPGLLAEVLEGRRPAAPRTIAQVDRRQPKVSLTASPPLTAERTVTLRISVEEAPATAANPRPSGARDLRLFRNGSLVKAWRGDLTTARGRIEVEATVPIRAGENRFIAYAFNHDNVKSPDASLLVESTAPRRPGVAYVLSIGINRYASPEFNLNFAVPDANRLAARLAQTQREMGTYARVVTVHLLDEQATRANVMLALARMGGQQLGPLPADAPSELAALEAVGPEDTVEVYFAGHGATFGDRFYLIPHDLAPKGVRFDARNSLESVLGSSISDQDLERAFEPIDAGNLMLIIDACSSGKALDAEDDRRGPLNNRGLAQLAYEKGILVLTAAQANQAALESSRLGHGYLTYALAEEGLNSSVADVKPADGQITAIEWFEYASRRVPQLQLEALREAAANQRPLIFDAAAPPGGVSARLQAPRLYYRRDDSSPALVVAKR